MTKKTFLTYCLSLVCFTVASDAFALPTDPQIVSGTAKIEGINPHVMEVRPSNHAILNYSKFDIGKTEKVRFIQESFSSCVLNRVIGKDPSHIFGSLESNGKVFLVNPNGIYFGPDSKVNVGSFIASTLDIANEDFLSEKYRFTLGKDSVIKNEGLLQSLEGSIVFMAPKIENLGSIEAKAGTVLLASGEHVTLDFAGDGLVQFSVEGSLKESLIEHLGEIKGSTVSIKLPMAKKAIQEIVNLDGLQEGDVFIEENGSIKFASTSSLISQNVLLEGATLSIEGSVDASNSEDKGGKVRLLGTEISLQGARIDASGLLGGGEVLIGGEYQGRGTTPYASKVVMDEASQILASAIEDGNGGLVVLWSQDHTSFKGNIYAQGGSISGNGGLVETSSLGRLEVDESYVDTAALKGQIGNWLLDPINLQIFDNSSCQFQCGSLSNAVCNSQSFCCLKPSAFTGSTSTVTLQACNSIYINENIAMSQPGAGVIFQITQQTCAGTSSSEFLIIGDYTQGTTTISTKGGPITFETLGSQTYPTGVVYGINQLVFDTTAGGSSGANITLPGLRESTQYVEAVNLTITAGSGAVFLDTILPPSDCIVRPVLIPSNITINSASYVQTSYINISGNLTMTSIPLVVSQNISSSPSPASAITAKNIYVNSIDARTSGISMQMIATQNIQIANNVGSSVVSGTVPPYSFSVFQGNLTVSSIATSGGSLVVESPLTLVGSPTIASNGGGIILGTSITLMGNLAVTSNGSSTSGGDITFGSTVDGSYSLTLTAGTGDVYFDGAVGGSTPIDLLQVMSAGIVNLQNVTTNGGQINVLSPVGLSNNASIVSNGGNITFGSTLLLQSSATMTSGNGNISIASTIDGSTAGTSSLALTAGTGTISFGGKIGSINPLLDFQIVSGNVVSWQDISTEFGSISITPAVSLDKGITLFSDGGNITFSSSIDAVSAGISSALSIALGTGGTLSIAGDIGLTKALESFEVLSGVSAMFLSITTSGDIFIVPPVTLTSTSMITSMSGDLTFKSYINGRDTGVQELLLAAPAGYISLLGNVGSSVNLLNFMISSGTIIGLANVTTSGGDITIVSPLNLNTNSVLKANSGNINIENTINASSTGSAAQFLTLDSVNGVVTLAGAVGGVNPLGALLIQDAFGLGVNLSGSISTTSNNASGGRIVIAPPLSLLGNVTMNTVGGGSGGYISLGAVTSTTGKSLECIAGTASVSVGVMGSGGFPIGPISITGSQITLGGNVVAQSLSINNSGQMTINGSSISLTGSFEQIGIGITDLGGNISAGSVAFATDLILTKTPITVAATAGDLSFENVLKLSGVSQSLTLTATGSITAYDGLNTDDVTMIAGGSVFVGGDLNIPSIATITAGNGVLIQGSTLVGSATITATGGDIVLGQVLADTDFTLETDAGSIFCTDVYTVTCTMQAIGSITINGVLDATNFTVLNCNGVYISNSIDISTVTLTNGTGTIVFHGSVTIGTLTTFSQGYGVEFDNGGIVHSAATFLNTGGVVLNGGSSSNFVFDGALTSTASLTTILGQIGTTTGSMSFGDLRFESGNSSLITVGYPISVSGITTLTGNATFTASGGGISFSDRVEGPGSLTLSPGFGSDLTFAASVGANIPLASLTSTNLRHAFVKGIRAGGQIHVSPDIDLSDSLTTFSAGAGVILGNVNGSTLGAQRLTITAGSNITVGVLGGNVALGTVLLEAPKSISIQNITTQGTITITGDTILSSAMTTLDTTAGPTWGFDVNLNEIDGTETGKQGLTINAGTMGVLLLEGSIGSLVPLSSLNLTGFSIFLGGSVVDVTGDQNYYYPTIVQHPCIFNTSGNITFHSSLDTTADLSPIIFYMGGGAMTLLEGVGNGFMGALSIFNSSSFSSQKITANSLRVTGGLPTITLNDLIVLSGPSGIFLDGGPIYLGGEIEAKHLFFRSSATMLNLDTPQPINISGDTPIALEYFNALGGNIGSPSSPIEINTVHASNLGANSRADFSGDPFHGFFFSIPSNPPCIVTFNGVTILDCNTTPLPEVVFGSIPRNLLYVPGLYSSWNNLSDDEYFEEMPANMIENLRDLSLFYVKPTHKSQKKKKSL